MVVPSSDFHVLFFSELLQCRVLFLFNATQLIALVLCFRPFLSMFLCRGLTFLTATCNFPEVICCRPISWPYWTDSNSRAAQCNPKLKSVGRTWAMDKKCIVAQEGNSMQFLWSPCFPYRACQGSVGRATELPGCRHLSMVSGSFTARLCINAYKCACVSNCIKRIQTFCS